MAKKRARTSVKRKKRVKAVPAQGPKASRPKAKAADPQSRGKWVYGFGDGRAEGKASMRDLLGGKGAGLAEMASLGLPVPPGFTITTDVCTYYYSHNKQYPKDLRGQVEKALAQVGRITGKKFGDEIQSSAGVGAIRCPRFDAGDDGHCTQSRSQRRNR